jgi:RES domain-containing protein
MGSLWRISNYASLDGEGGQRCSARWHTAGRRIVCFAESPAGALVEALVHLELDEQDWPRTYRLFQAEYPQKLRMETLEPGPAKGWQRKAELTRRLGDEWLRSERSALARVPSAILPDTRNVLLNPEHEDARQVRVVRTMRAEYVPRLIPAPSRGK